MSRADNAPHRTPPAVSTSAGRAGSGVSHFCWRGGSLRSLRAHHSEAYPVGPADGAAVRPTGSRTCPHRDMRRCDRPGTLVSDVPSKPEPRYTRVISPARHLDSTLVLL